MTAACASCSASLAASDATCESCSATLRPHGDALTVVTRGELPEARRLAQVFLTDAFRSAYRLDRAIGSGAMGMVYAATQVSTGRAVAVKFVVDDDRDALERFEREARVLARIAHPSVLRVLDYGVLDGHPYLVTELLPGDTLRKRLARGPLPLEAALAIARQLLEALEACHAAGVVHRDVKPDNVLFDEAGNVRLADLGLARWQSAGRSLTRAGEVVGTPRYMSPEQIVGDVATARSDLYALGCMLYEMIAGRPPYRGDSMSVVIGQHVNAPVPRLDQHARAPAALADVVASAMAKVPDDRPASAARMLAELDAAAAARPARRGGTSAPRRRAGLPAIALAAGVLGLGLAALAVTRPERSATPVRVAAPVSTTSPPAAPRFPGLTDAGAPLEAGVLGRYGSYWGAHRNLRSLELSADGGRLLSLGNQVLRVWDVRGRRMLFQRALRAGEGLMAFPARGDRVVVGRITPREELEVHAIDVVTGALATIPRAVRAISPDGEHLAQFDPGRAAARVHALAARATAVEVPLPARPQALALGPGARALYFAAGGRLVRWDVAAAKSAWSVPLELAPQPRMLVSADGRVLAVPSREDLTLFSADTGERLHRVTRPGDAELEFARDGSELLMLGTPTLADGRRVIAIDAANKRERDLAGGGLTAVAAAGGEVWLGNDGRFGPLNAWNDGFANTPRIVWLARDGARALYWSSDSELFLWERRTGLRRRLAQFRGSHRLAGVSPDGRTAHVGAGTQGSPGSEVHAFDLESGSKTVTWKMPPAPEALRSSIAPLDRPGRYLRVALNEPLALVEPDAAPRALDPQSETAARQLNVTGMPMHTVVHGVDRAARVALVNDPVALKLMRLRAGASFTIIDPGHSHCAALVENPLRVLVETSPGKLYLTDENGARVRRLYDLPDEHLRRLAASPDGTLGAAAFAASIVVWDLATGRTVARFPALARDIEHLAVDAVERVVVAGDAEEILSVHPLPAQ
jgi:hypothetical protein